MESQLKLGSVWKPQKMTGPVQALWALVIFQRLLTIISSSEAAAKNDSRLVHRQTERI